VPSHAYDALTPDQVITAVESLGYCCDARLLALNSYENRVYQVGLEDSQPLVAKFYRPDRWSRQQILEEHAFSLDLQSAEISVVAPLANDEGQTLHQHQDFLFALFPRRGGHPPELDNDDNLLVLGRTLGRIHRLGSSAVFSHRPTTDPVDTMQQASAFLLEQFIPPDLAEAYETLCKDLIDTVREVWSQTDSSDFIRVHGDCHVGNILWRDDTAHFVDLDDCRTAPAVQDLWMFLSGERQQRELQLSVLMEGYSDFCDFDPRQLNWIETLRTMRIVHYAAWLGRRWHDPAFPRAFSWFGDGRYWADHILELREQLAALQEPPLRLL